MNTMSFVAFQIFLLLTPAFGGYVFPDDFQTCKSTEDDYNGCLLSAIRDALPKLANPGISSPIVIRTEPVLSRFCEYHHNHDVFILDEYGYNLSHAGFVNSSVLNVSADLKNLHLNFTTFTPKMVQNSTYVIDGALLYNGTRDAEPIWGRGQVVKSLYNLTILHQIRSNTVERDGDVYIQVSSYNISASLDFITIEYDNLYNGMYPQRAERARSYINAKAPYIMGTMQKYVEEFLGSVFKSYANVIIGSVPFNKIIPDY